MKTHNVNKHLLGPVILKLLYSKYDNNLMYWKRKFWYNNACPEWAWWLVGLQTLISNLPGSSYTPALPIVLYYIAKVLDGEGCLNHYCLNYLQRLSHFVFSSETKWTTFVVYSIVKIWVKLCWNQTIVEFIDGKLLQ